MLVEEIAGLLTVPGAARRPNVPESVIRRAVALGQLAAVRKWQRVLIPQGDLERFVKERTEERRA